MSLIPQSTSLLRQNLLKYKELSFYDSYFLISNVGVYLPAYW